MGIESVVKIGVGHHCNRDKGVTDSRGGWLGVLQEEHLPRPERVWRVSLPLPELLGSQGPGPLGLRQREGSLA